MAAAYRNTYKIKKPMKKIITLLVIIFILTGTLIIFGYLIWQTKPSSISKQTQSNRQTEESRAAQQAAAPKQQAAAKVSTLMFDNQQQSLAIDAKFALKATIDPKGKKVSASELHIVFDPKMLKLESIVPSDDFSLVLANSQIDNEKGSAWIALGVPLGKPSIDSASPIATFNFRTLSIKGETKISFTDKSGAAADGESSNIVDSLVPTTIIVQ
jgi:hypothetical protein